MNQKQLLENTKYIYNEIAEKYNKIHKKLLPNEKKHWQVLADYIGENYPHKTINILEAGCGNGKDIAYARKNFGYNSTGIDFSEKFIEIARNNNPDISKENIILGDFCKLPFEDNSFDVVRHYASMVHIPFGEILDKALSETHRVLKKGGVSFILLRHGKGEEYIDTKEGLPKRFFQLYSEESLKVLMKKFHFQIQIIETLIGDKNKNWIYILVTK